MARTLKEGEHVFTERHRTGKYDWDSWTNGEVWVLDQGEDFGPEPKSFAAQLYIQAKTRRMKVRVTVNDTPDIKDVIFQFYNDEE